MKNKIPNALERLNKVLPLKYHQNRCDAEVKKLHQALLKSFVENGRVLTNDEMSAYLDDVERAISILQEFDMVVTSAEGVVTGVYPFTMETREHKVKVNNFTVHAMCALDALAISSMFAIDTKISSRCRVTKDDIYIEQSETNIKNADSAAGIFFGIIWAATAEGSCANSLCMEMLFLKNESVADKWLHEDIDDREIFTLDEAVEFSARFFVPLMS